MKITKNVINFCNNSRVRKVIFLSAVLAYGLISKKVISENDKPIKPNLYGKSKFISERLFCEKSNFFKAICLRIPGIFTTDLTKDHPLVIKIIKKLIKNKVIHTYNFNEKFNNILDTKEIVKFINVIIRKKYLNSGVYNFAASDPVKFINALIIMKKILQSKSKIINRNIDKISFTISVKKIKKDFNFNIEKTTNIIVRGCREILKKNYIFI